MGIGRRQAARRVEGDAGNAGAEEALRRQRRRRRGVRERMKGSWHHRRLDVIQDFDDDVIQRASIELIFFLTMKK